MRKRTRYSTDVPGYVYGRPGLYEYEFWQRSLNVDPATGTTYWGEDALTKLGVSQEWKTERMDDVASGDWQYQDCLHYRRRSEYARDPWNDNAPKGTLSYLHTPFSLQRASFYYPWAAQFREVYSAWWNVINMDTTEDVYQHFFASSALPRTVTIDRDPYSNGFTVWALIMDLYEARGLASQFAQLSRDAVAARRLRNIDKPLRVVANSNLLLQFGIAPTLQDIEDFVDALTALARLKDTIAAIEKLVERKRFGTNSTVDAAVSASLGITTTEPQSYPFGLDVPGFRLNIDAQVQHLAPKYHRTVRYQFKAPEALGWLARLGAYVDKLGVFDPEAIWDRVPFSFVVDWFLDISSWLHAHRPRTFQFDIHVLDYCESIKYETRVDYFGSYYLPYYSSGNERGPLDITREPRWLEHQPLGSDTCTQYVRRRMNPVNAVRTTSGLARRNSGWTFRRETIVAALLAQQLLRVRTRASRYLTRGTAIVT